MMAPKVVAFAAFALATALQAPARRPTSATRRRAKGGGDLPDAVSQSLEKMREVSEAWKNRGWQVRKRQGSWFPEILPQPGAPWAGAALEKYEPDAAEDGKGERDQWLASASKSATALSKPSAADASRELAVTSDFSTFLARPEIASSYARGENGEIVFQDEAALGATVAVFAVELTRELGAAARALARYVDDLEAELAAADEGAVRLRAQLSDAENDAAARAEAAAAEARTANEMREAAARSEAMASKALEDAADAERRCEATAREMAATAARETATVGDVAEAKERALALETRLVDAEAAAAKLADEAANAARQRELAEGKASAAAAERDATDGVLAAMRARVEAAERAAADAAKRATDALERAGATEAELRKSLEDALRDAPAEAAANGAVADAEAARRDLAATVAAAAPLSKMRKADLVAECLDRGLDVEGLRVPELRVQLRGARAAAAAAEAPANGVSEKDGASAPAAEAEAKQTEKKNGAAAPAAEAEAKPAPKKKARAAKK